MTPTNTAMTPEIKNIADIHGDKHTVIPTPHNHSQNEVEGLVAALATKADTSTVNTALATKADTSTVNTALAGKQNTLTFDTTPTAGSTNPVTSGGVKTVLDAKANKNELGDSESGTFVKTDNNTLYLSGNQRMILGISDPDDEFVEISNDNIQNLRRALANPDTTPTANSTRLVTSGGVKTALEGKANAIPFGAPRGAIVIAGTSGEIARSNKTIQDLLNAIAAKQDALTFDTTPTAGSTNPVTSGGVKVALDNKATYYAIESREYLEDGYSQVTADNDAELGGNIVITVRKGNGQTKTLHIHSDNIENIERALLNPDSTPTANSNNLVTSGGVKAALDGKPSVYDTEVVFMEEETPFIYLPDYFTHGEKQKTFIMDYQGASMPFADIFHAQNTDIIRILSHDDEIINIAECFLSFRVIRQANGIAQGSYAYYVIFDGKNLY